MAVDGLSNSVAVSDYKEEPRVQPAQKPVKVAEPSLEKDAQANKNYIKSVIDDVNNKIKDTRTRCEYTYHEDIKRVSIKIYDMDTNEVIREIPSEEILEVLQRLWEVAGLLVDKKC